MEEKVNKPKVRLTGIDGNAYVIMGAASKAIKSFYRDTEEDGNKIADEYYAEATSGDYDHLLQTTMKYCEVS